VVMPSDSVRETAPQPCGIGKAFVAHACGTGGCPLCRTCKVLEEKSRIRQPLSLIPFPLLVNG